MADEEKKDLQPAEAKDAANEASAEAANEAPANDAAEPAAAKEPDPAESADAPEPAEPGPDADPEPPAEPPAEVGVPPAAAPPVEDDQPVLGPKQRRKLARSRASGAAGPQRLTGDRVAERTEVRRSKAAERRRWRARQRTKRTATAGERATPAQPVHEEAEPGKRKTRQGVVVSSKGEKTITVRIDTARRHRVYKKVVRESGRLHVHDESNAAGEGDLVRVVECRPLSRTKRWRLVEVLEKAK